MKRKQPAELCEPASVSGCGLFWHPRAQAQPECVALAHCRLHLEKPVLALLPAASASAPLHPNLLDLQGFQHSQVVIRTIGIIIILGIIIIGNTIRYTKYQNRLKTPPSPSTSA